MGSFDIVTFIFFIVAVVIFIQLRSVLGRRDSSDDARIERRRARREAPPIPADDPKVVTLPSRGKDGEPQPDQMAAIEGYLKGCQKLGVKHTFVTVDLHEGRDVRAVARQLCVPVTV